MRIVESYLSLVIILPVSSAHETAQGRARRAPAILIISRHLDEGDVADKGGNYSGRLSIRDLLGNGLEEIYLSLKPNSFSGILQNHDQSATGRLVPLSATIDTISINFLNTKTSFIYFFKS
jgi:hypothetical protein